MSARDKFHKSELPGNEIVPGSTATWVIRSARKLGLLLIVSLFAGCSTLGSLGLPFGNSNNEIIDPAKSISETPGQSLLLPKELAVQPLDLYIVEIGDLILIEPVKFDSTMRLPGDQVVKPDGYVSVGECGRLMVAGKSIEQIQLEAQSMIDNQIRLDLETAFLTETQAAEIDRAIRLDSESSRKNRSPNEHSDGNETDQESESAPDLFEKAVPFDVDDQHQNQEARVALDRRIEESIRQNKISVRLVNWDSKRVYVLGEVNSPGAFNFSGNQTVLDGIIEAGGLSSRADRHQIIVARPTTCDSCRIVMKVCYDQVVQLGDASTNYQLQPGDRVFVPSLTFCEDLMKSLHLKKNDRCPRCSNCQQGCDLPEGCE